MRLRLQRPGFTLVQSMVVVGIIAVLIALLIPAVQLAREAANRTACQNNLRQITLGLHQYEGNTETLPSLSVYHLYWKDGERAATYSNWLTTLLPYLEQQAVFDAYDPNAMFYSSPAAIATPVKTFLCPSAPHSDPLDHVPGWRMSGAMLNPSLRPYDVYLNAAFVAAVSDYAGFNKVNDEWMTILSYPAGSPPLLGLLAVPPAATPQELDAWLAGGTVGPRASQVRLAEATDGLSNTILFVEDGGRPQKWVAGTLVDPNANVHGAGMGGPGQHFLGRRCFLPALHHQLQERQRDL